MRIYIVIILCLWSVLGLAQTEDNRIPLIDYIKTLEKQKSIVFSYDAKLLKPSKLIPPSNLNFDQTLAYLNNQTAFQFKKFDNNTIIVTPYEANKNIRICIDIIDDELDERLNGATIYGNQLDKGIVFNANEPLVLYVNEQDWLQVHINYLGFESITFPIDYFNGETCQEIRMNASETILNSVTVNYLTKGINYDKDDQSINVKVKNAGLLPGETETDILTTLQTLPGINSSSGKAGDLVMRGDNPDKTFINFDNIPIFHNGHYFGTFSPYNAAILNSVKVKRNGYDVENGGRVGGLIELKTTNKVSDSLTAEGGLATSYFLANLDTPIIKDKLSLVVGFRSSYPFDWESPKMKAISDFVFQHSVLNRSQETRDVSLTKFQFNFSDFNIKTIYEINERHKLSLSYLNIYNKLNLNAFYNGSNNSPGTPNFPSGTQDFNQVVLKNSGINLSLLSNWNEKINNEFLTTYSSFIQDFDSQLVDASNTIFTETIYDNSIQLSEFKNTTNINLKGNQQIDFGINFKNYHLDLDRFSSNSTISLNERDRDDAQLYAAFTSYQLATESGFTTQIGLRANSYSVTNKIYWEPRVLLNYEINKSVALKSSAGIYHQFVNHLSGRRAVATGVEQYNWKLSNGNTIPVVKGSQFMLGAIFSKNKWIIDLEGYYKQTENIATYNLYQFDNDQFFIGNYNTIGLDLLIKKSWHNFDAWISYTNIKTLADFDAIQQNSFRSIWDQNNIFNIVFSYRMNAFKVSAGWTYKTGLASLENIRDFYINGPPIGNPVNLNQTYNPLHDPSYGAQLPDQHQLDISASYTVNPKVENWNLTIGLAATNVYNQQNIIGQKRDSFQNNGYTLRNIYGLGFSPNMLIKLRF